MTILNLRVVAILITLLSSLTILVGSAWAVPPTDNTRPGWGFGDVNHIHTGPPGQSIVISGNGQGSVNTVTVNTSNNETITQSNNANVTVNVNALSNSGGNHSDGNNGGNSSIHTGLSQVFVNIMTFLGINVT